MKQYELEKAISSGSLPRSIMLYGDCHFSITRYIDRISQYFAAGDEPLKLYYNEYSFEAAKAHLNQGSLFGGANVLIVKNDKKVPKSDLDALIAMVNKSDINFFIYAYTGTNIDANLTKAFTKKVHADFVRFFPPKPNEAIAILAQLSREKGIRIDNNTLAHLYRIENEDLALSANDLNKLAILDKEIHNKDVDALIHSLSHIKLDSIIYKLIMKEPFLEDLKRSMELKEEPIEMITYISSYISRLFLFYCNVKIEGNSDAKSVLGYFLPMDLQKQQDQLCRRFNDEKFSQVLTLLTKAEYSMKSEVVDKASLLLHTLLEIQRCL